MAMLPVLPAGPQLPRPGDQLHRHFNDYVRASVALGLIDEYRLSFRPLILGGGRPYFSGPRPPLRLINAESVGEDTVRLIYAVLT